VFSVRNILQGVLRDKRDLELFDEDFRSKFEPKPNPAYMM
jgi:hypothetical protein